MSPNQPVPSIEALPQKIRAADLVALSDTGLGRYLEEHRLDGGVGIHIDVEDPENLPGSFIEKLRDKARELTDAARAGAVNLNEVNSRLLNVVRSDTPVDDHDPAQFVSSMPSTRASTPGNDMVERNERECYEELVGDGGRPTYPIELVNQLAEDPAAYPHLARPWPLLPRMRSMIFEAQLHHWKSFRHWQENTRYQGPLSHIQYGLPKEWDANRSYNVFVTQFLSKASTYSEAAVNLLMEHHFSRPGLQFLQDPTQQDKLTEWIEYVTFECAQQNRYAYQLQRRQKQIDVCWERLAGSGLLRPYETREYVCDKSSTPAYQAEIDKLHRELDLAEFEFEEAQSDINTDPATMATATQKLEEAKSALEVFQRRKELNIAYNEQVFDLRDTKKEKAKHERLLQWAFDQVPLVEAEVRTTPTTEGGSSGTAVPPNGAATRKRAREATGSANGNPPPKRSRNARPEPNDSGIISSPKALSPKASTPPSQQTKTRPRRKQPTVADGSSAPPPAHPTLSGQPRRSARITESREKAALDKVSGEKTAPKKATKPATTSKAKAVRETQAPAKPAKASPAGARAPAAPRSRQRKQPAPRKRC